MANPGIPDMLPKELIDRINSDAKQLESVKVEIEKAKAAKVPNMHLLEEKLLECEACIAALKENYFPKPRRK